MTILACPRVIWWKVRASLLIPTAAGLHQTQGNFQPGAGAIVAFFGTEKATQQQHVAGIRIIKLVFNVSLSKQRAANNAEQRKTATYSNIKWNPPWNGPSLNGLRRDMPIMHMNKCRLEFKLDDICLHAQ